MEKQIENTSHIERIIGSKGKGGGPTLVFFGGIHGNEKAGLFALQDFFKQENLDDIEGKIIGIAGNLSALKEGKRFIDRDLNRIWTRRMIEGLSNKESLDIEEKEQLEVYSIIKSVLSKESGPFYFIDFHTTSSPSQAFITINDSLINRRFALQFDVPIVLGIEEYLEGPLLSYINSLGYVSLGFEAGQHDDPISIANCYDFIIRSMEIAGIKKSAELLSTFDTSGRLSGFYEVIYVHKIENGEKFQMNPGFESFQTIEKGRPLAKSNQQEIRSEYNARLFMPLYQKRGREGFFIIRRIPRFFLSLSSFLRRIKADQLLVYLPGIVWEDKQQGILKVNTNVTRFLAKQIFHLFGYRNKRFDRTHLLLFNRERVSQTGSYKNLRWFKSPRRF